MLDIIKLIKCPVCNSNPNVFCKGSDNWAVHSARFALAKICLIKGKIDA